MLQDGPGVPSFPAPQPPVGSSPPVPPSRPTGRRSSNRVRAPLPPLPRGIKDETWEEQGKPSLFLLAFLVLQNWYCIPFLAENDVPVIHCLFVTCYFIC